MCALVQLQNFSVCARSTTKFLEDNLIAEAVAAAKSGGHCEVKSDSDAICAAEPQDEGHEEEEPELDAIMDVY